eukprot:3906621-Ditylum_brightwellii.AAC.1
MTVWNHWTSRLNHITAADVQREMGSAFFDGKCRAKCIVYKATCTDCDLTYIGLCNKCSSTELRNTYWAYADKKTIACQE